MFAVMLASIGGQRLSPRSVQAVGPRRPDIVLIVTDDQRRETGGWMLHTDGSVNSYGSRSTDY